MKLNKAQKRDKEIQKRKSGHSIETSNASLDRERKRTLQIKKEREQKENLILISELD